MDKEKLKEYRGLIVELDGLDERIQRLKASLYGAKNQIITDMPRGGQSTDTADKIAKLRELYYHYNDLWDEAINGCWEIENAIEKLSDPYERAIMRHRYIDGYSWEQISIKIGYSWRQTHNLHSLALQKIQVE